MRQAALRGSRIGNPNPELSVKKMVEGSKQAKVEFAKKIRASIDEIKSAGVATLQGIADCLNRRGIFTRTGKQWQPQTVKNLLAVGV